MSVMRVNENVIQILVEALYRYEISVPKSMTPDKLGSLLWRENHRSFNALYGVRTRTPSYHHNSKAPCFGRRGDVVQHMVDLYHHKATPDVCLGTVQELARDPGTVLGVVGTYHYQLDGCDGWESTRAYAYTKALEEKIRTSMGAAEAAASKKDAPWGIH